MKICLIGSGSLALGLVYPWLSRIDTCEISLVTRKGKAGGWSNLLARAETYTLELRGETFRQELQRPPLIYDPGDLEAEPARRCMECLAASDVAIVSVGVGNTEAVARLIARSCILNATGPLHLFDVDNRAKRLHRAGHRTAGRGLGAGAHDGH